MCKKNALTSLKTNLDLVIDILEPAIVNLQVLCNPEE